MTVKARRPQLPDIYQTFAQRLDGPLFAEMGYLGLAS